ncbi:MAG: amidase, partial [Chloroflexi bacterium]|nr:amidase [Chloroflexota bacterium]
MDHREPYDLSIVEAGVALRDGTVTAVELTESVLDRLEATEPLLNAYITVTAELAREQASAADDLLRDGRDLGPLHGIPVALKDLVDTAGIPTTGGGGFLRDRVPDSDAVVYAKLKEAGAVMPGKLNLHEFAFGTTSRNPHYGAVHNPWDLAKVPGGSSGGSGASVAVGSSLGALGSDTGGSIRIPASVCGVTGLMGTYGRVSRRGVLPLSWTLDHVGPLTKTVEDAGLILNAIAGYDAEDPGSADVPVGDCTATLVEGVDGIRIGIPRQMLWQGCAEDVIEHCEIAVDHLRSMGATVE